MKLLRIAASADAILTRCKIYGVYLMAAGADSSIILFDKAAASGGTAKVTVTAATKTSNSFVFPGGFDVDNLSATLAGSGAECYVLYD